MIAHDFPYPPWHGGRAEMLGRLEAGSSVGLRMALVATVKELPDAEHQRVVEQLAEAVYVERRRGQLAAAMRFAVPYQIASRGVSRGTVRSLEARHRQSPFTHVLCDGLYGIAIARRLAIVLGVPIVLRSHNVESDYFREISRMSSGWRRLAFRLEALRMARLERTVGLSDSTTVSINLTPADAARNAGRMPCRQEVVGPFAHLPAEPRTHSSPPPPNAMFVGSLFLPANWRSVKWLSEVLWPDVLSSASNASLLIAGRGASSGLERDLRLSPGISFLGEVDDTESLYQQSRVFVNPSRAGSGLNMKNLEALLRGVPVVTTSVGGRGFEDLPPGAVRSSDDPHLLSAWTCSLLTDDELWRRSSAAARDAAKAFESSYQLTKFMTAIVGEAE